MLVLLGVVPVFPLEALPEEEEAAEGVELAELAGLAFLALSAESSFFADVWVRAGIDLPLESTTLQIGLLSMKSGNVLELGWAGNSDEVRNNGSFAILLSGLPLESSCSIMTNT